jgi:hypothetical protein
MRSLLAILAIMLTPAAAVLFWARSHSEPPVPSTTFQPRSVVWADRVFTRPTELRRWLRARGERYDVWAHAHPSQAARLEHRRPPRAAAAKPAKPAASPRTKARAPAEPNGGGSGHAGSLVTAAEILAALLAVTATVGLALRARRRVRLPRIRPPTINVDFRPLADGLGNVTARLAQVRLPEAPSLGRSRAEPSPARVEEPARNGHRNGVPPAPVVEAETLVAEIPNLAPAVVSPPPALLETLPVADGTWELCTTACWRGYVTARFYAHPAGNDTSLAESEPLDWRAWDAEPRNPPAAEAALDALRARLERDGWEAIGRGRAWYEVRYRRQARPEW